jgi:uncharacterized membrane protein (UPF0127 family)
MRKYSFLFFLFFGLIFSCKNEDKGKVKPIEINFTKEAELVFLKQDDTLVSMDIELAESDYEQQTGLMHRSEMDMKQGMLFLYDDERPRPSFYMKNTKLPLDLIYINANKRVVEINKDTKPFDETPIRAQQPAQYVLEVNAGFAEKFNINDSLYIEFKRLK